ncbi:MAG: hypothetical protein ACOYNC_08360 [Bacteroidales bacterium]
MLNEPGSVDDRSLLLVEDLTERYPYCQSGQLLLAGSYYLLDNRNYPDQLKKAAACAGDRRVLRALIGQVRTAEIVQSAEIVHSAEVLLPEPVPFVQPEPQDFRIFENEVFTHERLTPEELLSIVKRRLAEIESEKKLDLSTAGVPPESAKENLAPGTGNAEMAAQMSKESLIDKFILEEPRISKPKAAFFNPSDSSFRSNFDEEEIVSETLAQLYAQQGNIQKAIHIYDKLSLINQEKSRYFAAQIEKLSS